MFDFDKPGTEPADHEAGIEFHRVGNDLIRKLVNHAAAVAEPPVAGSSSTTTTANGGDGDRQGEVRRDSSPAPRPIPRLDSAAFLVADRARSTTEPATETFTGREARVGQFGGIGGPPASSPSDEPTVPAPGNGPPATSTAPAPHATDGTAVSSGAEPAPRQEGKLPLEERPTSSSDSADHANREESERPEGSVPPIEKQSDPRRLPPKPGCKRASPASNTTPFSVRRAAHRSTVCWGRPPAAKSRST